MRAEQRLDLVPTEGSNDHDAAASHKLRIPSVLFIRLRRWTVAVVSVMKPVLIGLSNPYSDDPGNALAPYPERSAGHRLWQMLANLPAITNTVEGFQAGLDQYDYADSFVRMNLFPSGPNPPRSQWRGYAMEALSDIPVGSQAILLGVDVLEAMSTALTTALQTILIHPQVVDGVTWRLLPHPSGRSRTFNDPVNRALAGMLLADVLQEAARREPDVKKQGRRRAD